MSTVRIEANKKTGELVTQNPNKPSYGSVMVRQEGEISLEGGFMNKSDRVAFIGGDYEALKSYVEQKGYKDGSEIKGKIVIEESLTPFYEGQNPKINPETGEVLTKGGQPIYRQALYTANLEKQDGELIQHDRVSVGETSQEVTSEELGAF